MATSVTLKPNAIDISGSTSGTTTLQATAVAGTTTLTLPAATDTLVGKATTDTLTNKTLTGAAMNGTVGATTPSTGAFTTLSATGAASFTGANPSLSLGNGNASAGSLRLNPWTATNYNWLIDNGVTTAGTLNITPSTAVGGNTYTTSVAMFSTTGLAVTGLVDISAATSGQIKFPATENASSNGNTLDDYEEGTWTPSLGGTATYTSQVGRYTKVGRLVTFQCSLAVLSIGTGSTTQISGLPFTAAFNSGNGGHAIYYETIDSNVSQIVAYIGTTNIVLHSTTTFANSIGPFSIFRNGTNLTFQGFYFV